MLKKIVVTATVALLAMGGAACSGTAGAEVDTAAGDQPTVAVDNMAFAPKTLVVSVGTTVTWTFSDGAVVHDVAGDDFASEAQSEGTFSHRFDEPGTYTYLCTLHPNMTGEIEVTQ